MKKTLAKLHWLLSSQFGFDPLRLMRSLCGLPVFMRDWLCFRSQYKGRLVLLPCLHDRFEEGGTTRNEYFWQDLLVARWIHDAAPIKHVDIGSRVDGFVAHVASFREIEVFDVRPVTTQVPGVVFHHADLMSSTIINSLVSDNAEEGRGKVGYCDSLSCLHALEHFGLGRYGDPINPQGYRLGLENMAKLLRDGGVFYLSTPIGLERVEFNASWVFDPRELVKIARAHGLQLSALTVFRHKIGIQELDPRDDVLAQLAEEQYNLGIFTFHKTIQER